MPIGTTITEYIIEEQRRIKGVSGEFGRSRFTREFTTGGGTAPISQ